MDIANISGALSGAADLGHRWVSQAQNAYTAASGAVAGRATGVAAGLLAGAGAATAGVALQNQPMAYRQALQNAVDSVIDHYTKNGVTDLSALSANAANAQSVAKNTDKVLEARLNDPSIPLEAKLGIAAQAQAIHQQIHLDADIATAAANKAGQAGGGVKLSGTANAGSSAGSSQAQSNKEVDDVIARFSGGQPLTIDTVKAVYDNGVQVHANATRIITDKTRIVNDPKASAQEKNAAVSAMERATHRDDVAVAAVGKAQQTYIDEQKKQPASSLESDPTPKIDDTAFKSKRKSAEEEDSEEETTW